LNSEKDDYFSPPLPVKLLMKIIEKNEKSKNSEKEKRKEKERESRDNESDEEKIRELKMKIEDSKVLDNFGVVYNGVLFLDFILFYFIF
jgi:hypothetical protein